MVLQKSLKKDEPGKFALPECPGSVSAERSESHCLSSTSFELLHKIRSSQLLPLNISEILQHQTDISVLLEMPQSLRDCFSPVEVAADGMTLL